MPPLPPPPSGNAAAGPGRPLGSLIRSSPPPLATSSPSPPPHPHLRRCRRRPRLPSGRCPSSNSTSSSSSPPDSDLLSLLLFPPPATSSPSSSPPPVPVVHAIKREISLMARLRHPHVLRLHLCLSPSAVFPAQDTLLLIHEWIVSTELDGAANDESYEGGSL